MKINRTVLLFIGLVVGVVLLISLPTLAQPDDACTALVEQALDQLDNVCSGLGRNSVCYGYTLVQATFAEATDEFIFDAPADRAAIEDLTSIRTSPLDEDGKTWGIAVMNTQANLPNTLPGQGVVMLLMGEAETVNTVTADSSFQVSDPIMLTVIGDGSRIRTGASVYNNILGVLNSGDTVGVDAVSEDGEWLRVVYDDSIGWMFRSLVDISADQFASLPVLDDRLQAPMQAFYFTSGIGNLNCNEAPNILVVQSPRGAKVNLTVNEAEITIGSTVVLQIVGDQMILYVIDGEAQVNNLIIPAGFKAFVDVEMSDGVLRALLDQGIEIIQVGEGLPTVASPWRSCATISPEEYAWLGGLEGVPESLLNYSITMPDDENAYCGSPEEIAEIERANSYQCSLLKPTSPLDGMNWGSQQFWWDGVPDVTDYLVTVYNNGGGVVAQGSTTSTFITLDTGGDNLTGGVNYSWKVEARDASQNVVCSSSAVTIARGSAPPEVLNPPDPDPKVCEPPPSPYCDDGGMWIEAPYPTCWVCEYDLLG